MDKKKVLKKDHNQIILYNMLWCRTWKILLRFFFFFPETHEKLCISLVCAPSKSFCAPRKFWPILLNLPMNAVGMLWINEPFKDYQRQQLQTTFLKLINQVACIVNHCCVISMMHQWQINRKDGRSNHLWRFLWTCLSVLLIFPFHFLGLLPWRLCPPHLRRNLCWNAVRVGLTAPVLKGFLSLPGALFFFFFSPSLQLVNGPNVFCA